MITMIHRSKLEPHPDNPRKDLGDLSELAASIRKQGILQNLTVVPSPDSEDKYRIVIGHRRFAASYLAGLAELPCNIDEKMTYAEQIAVMMSENIQRNDLTITEKAGGVQMMMDLGMGVGEIAGNTGISDTTVRRYAKISKLNRTNMAQAEQRGATLMQFSEICEIEDDALRNEALEKAGTGEYNSVMFKVRAARERRERLPLIVEKLGAFASEIEKEDYSRYIWSDCFRFADSNVLDKLDKFKRKDDTVYAYIIRDYDIVVYEERPAYDDAKQEAKRVAQERLKARANHELEVASCFKEMRRAFFKDISLKHHEEDAIRFVVWVMTRKVFQSCPTHEGLFEYKFIPLREEEPETYTESISVSAEEIFQIPKRELLVAAVIAAFDRINTSDKMTMLERYTGKPKEDTKIVRGLYEHMERLGYTISADEQAWLDGTHECFTYPHDETEVSS